MLKTVLVSTGIVVLLVIAQSTWFHAIAILGVVPDLALVTLVYVSFRNRGVEGQIAGFLSGIVQDFISAAPLGLNALVKTFSGFCFGLVAGSFYLDRIFLPLLFGVVATLLKALMLGVASLAFPGSVHAYDLASPTLWVEAGYNGLASPIVFFILGMGGRLFVNERVRG